MSLFADAIQRGTRASQPAASAVVVGTLYFVTDEGVTERSSGSAWETFTDGDVADVGTTETTTLDGTDGDKISDMLMVGSTITLTELADASGDAVQLDVAPANLGYTPSPDNDKWNAETDPGSIFDALDQLSQRVANLERAAAMQEQDVTHDWERNLGDPFLYSSVLLPCREITATADVTLTTADPSYIFIDGNGSNRNLDLPTEVTGMCFFIMNISDTETITVRDDGASTVATLAAGGFTTVIYSGTAWRDVS